MDFTSLTTAIHKLTERRDALLHLFGGQPRVRPNHRDLGNIDVGKDVRWRRGDGRKAEDDDDDRRNDERVRFVDC